MQPCNKISRFRVPVSAAEELWPEPETQLYLEQIGQALFAIRQLKELGWTAGADQELLPPMWARREFE
jgi:hypothetical protein